jgi:hypothetical protein
MPSVTLAVLSTLTSTLKLDPTAPAGITAVEVVPESTMLTSGLAPAAWTGKAEKTIGMTRKRASAKATTDLLLNSFFI